MTAAKRSQERYRKFIRGLKDDNFTIVGYARKSPNDISNKMTDCLRNRSLTERVYVSPRSLASSKISSRDMPEPVLLKKLELDDCPGSMQIIQHLRREYDWRTIHNR
ncbi:hypothetical protein BCR43DRAFT_103890 [Syncephalastrum racemosum]|uniref:Uncharacterized protein n=1 Tax=Syncephalastrum racemosum TaxID=13706 RepID=A0A1X2H1S8_SYNRA|nr:hypothetical protein BCR43DRAFT_103890 [Syncephalastrum racemosum]